MFLGQYNTYLNAVSSFNLSILVPMGIGLIIGSVFILKLITFLLKSFKNETYVGIIGFALGSIFILWTGISFDINGFLCIAFLILGFILSKKLLFFSS